MYSDTAVKYRDELGDGCTSKQPAFAASLLEKVAILFYKRCYLGNRNDVSCAHAHTGLLQHTQACCICHREQDYRSSVCMPLPAVDKAIP